MKNIFIGAVLCTALNTFAMDRPDMPSAPSPEPYDPYDLEEPPSYISDALRRTLSRPCSFKFFLRNSSESEINKELLVPLLDAILSRPLALDKVTYQWKKAQINERIKAYFTSGNFDEVEVIVAAIQQEPQHKELQIISYATLDSIDESRQYFKGQSYKKPPEEYQRIKAVHRMLVSCTDRETIDFSSDEEDVFNRIKTAFSPAIVESVVGAQKTECITKLLAEEKQKARYRVG